MPDQDNNRSSQSAALLFFLAAAFPFFINDFSNIYVHDWRVWLFIDYALVRLPVCIICVHILRRGIVRPLDLGLTGQKPLPFAEAAIAVTFIGTVIVLNGYTWLPRLVGNAALGTWPAITNPAWRWVDLTFGLLLTGFTEELVFRGYMEFILRRFINKDTGIILVSSVVFGLIHWSNGPHAIITTALAGAAFMIFYLRTRSLPAIMLAHAIIDFIGFSGLIPQTWFIIGK